MFNTSPDSCKKLHLHYLFGGPLEACYDTVLDLIKVLYSLGDINEEIRAHTFRSEAPDLSCLSNIEVVGVSEITGTLLHLLSGGDLALQRKQQIPYSDRKYKQAKSASHLEFFLATRSIEYM